MPAPTAPPAWTPIAALAGRFAANLAALAARAPDVADRVGRFVPPEPFFIRATDDGVRLGVGDPVRELPVTLAPGQAQSTAAALCPNGHVGAPLLVAGEDQGWLWDRLYRLPCATYVPGWRPPLYFVMPDLGRLRVLLHLHDWRTLLADARVRLFAGPTAVDDLAETMATDLPCPPPHAWVTVGTDVWPAGVDPDALRTTAIDRRAAGYDRDRAAPRPTPTPPGSGRPLRVLGITSRYTTFLQHSMRDWLAAFEHLGHQTRLDIELADHELTTPAVTARYCAAFRPDLIVSIDHGRHTLDGCPPEVPMVMWVQDHLPHIYSRDAGRAQGERDFCVGFGRLQLSRRYGYPADRFLSACVGVNDDRFAPTPLTPAERAAFACDVSYVSHASTPADVLLADKVAALGSADGVRLYRDAFDRTVAHYEAGGPALLEPGVRALLRAAMDATGVRCSGPVEAAAVQFFQQTIGNAVFRHQTLRWVADTGVDLRLYGRGWDRHPTLAKFAAGTADNATQLSAIYRASRVNLQAIVTGVVHQRLLDGLAAGGFFVARHTPIDAVGRHYVRLWDWCQRHRIADEADFRRRADADVRRTCDLVNAILGYDMAATDLPLFDCLQTSADAGFMNTATAVWPTDYDRIAFDDAAGLRARLDTFLGDDDARRSVALSMREPVIERASYRRITARLLDLIADRRAPCHAAA